ncbi:MAG: TAXI family TRAP transporter solute-binding subunit [Alphaproteobacteria bacterium]|nr:TAXI family TRAP transporter solute-binding subunit [Alphaproteobacteria bacterium]
MTKTSVRIACIAAFAAIAASTAAEAKLKRITIGSNRQGSVFYLLSSTFAKVLQQNMKVRATAQPHAGSTVYLPVVNKGEMTLGLNNSMDSGAAVRGGAPFKKKLKNIRAIAMVWTIPYGFMVKANSGIKSVADLKGKKVVTRTGPIISLSSLNVAYLHSGGLGVKDITAIRSGGVVDGITKVVEGRADAAALAPGMPAVRKAHATVPGGIRFIPLGAGGSDAFLAREVPGAKSKIMKPNKRMPFMKQKTRLAAFDAYLNAGSQVSNADAYAIIKVLHTQWKKMQKSVGPLRPLHMDKIAPATNPHPYHDGVVKYLKEKGLWTAANAKQQKAVLAVMK